MIQLLLVAVVKIAKRISRIADVSYGDTYLPVTMADTDKLKLFVVKIARQCGGGFVHHGAVSKICQPKLSDRCVKMAKLWQATAINQLIVG